MADLIIDTSKYYIDWNQTIDDKLKVMLAFSSILDEMKRVCSLVMEWVYEDYQATPSKYMKE